MVNHKIAPFFKNAVRMLFRRFGFEIIRRNRPVEIDFQLLLAIFFKRPENFFFVQIGANDGKRNDPIYDFVVKYNLSGLLVEPQKDVFERLKQNYSNNKNLIFANVAVSDKNGPQIMYAVQSFFEDIYKKPVDGLTSFKKNHVRKMIKKAARSVNLFLTDEQVDGYVGEIKTDAVTMETLLNRYNVKDINLLLIDTEGYDYDIIKMVDFGKFLPEIIIYESKHLKKAELIECESLLRRKGYAQFIWGSNSCAFQVRR